MKTFLETWDLHFNHLSKKEEKYGDETVLDTQDWYWKEPYIPWDPGIGGHTDNSTTVSKKSDSKEDDGNGRDGEETNDLSDELSSI